MYYWSKTGADNHWTTRIGNWWYNAEHDWQAEELPTPGSDVSVDSAASGLPDTGPDAATVFASIDIQDGGGDYSLPATVYGGSVSYSGAGTLTIGGHVGAVTAGFAGVSLAAGASCGDVSCAGVFSAGNGCSFGSVSAGGSGQCIVGTGATVAIGAQLRGDGWNIGESATFVGDMDAQCSEGQTPATSIGANWKVKNGAAGGSIALRGGTEGLTVGAPHAAQVRQFGNVSLAANESGIIDADDMGSIGVAGDFSVSGGTTGYSGPSVQILAPFTGTAATPAGTVSCASATDWETTRNTDPGVANVLAPASGGPAGWKFKSATNNRTGTYAPPAGGSSPRPRRF